MKALTFYKAVSIECYGQKLSEKLIMLDFKSVNFNKKFTALTLKAITSLIIYVTRKFT
jgi:hypothetical protein